MRITLVNNSIIPVSLYGGTERVLWYLGRELVKLGHQVTFLVKKGSSCDFARVVPIDESRLLVDQIPVDTDLVHFQFLPEKVERVQVPYLVTIHGNAKPSDTFDINTVFVSKNHAARHSSQRFVYNGLDWTDYSRPDFLAKRGYFHFLGNAAWRVKNVQGAIDVIQKTKLERLGVLGGHRFNFRMGLRLTFSTRIQFYGMVGGIEKDRLLNGSKGLLFPVRWHEPFGLAIIESLYFGCPVFGTPYGSLPELVPADCGFLSAHSDELVQVVEDSSRFSSKKCHEYALENFNSYQMALAYQECYQRVLDGEKLNSEPPKVANLPQEKFLPWS